MLLLDRFWIIAIAAGLAVTCTACQQKSTPTPPADSGGIAAPAERPDSQSAAADDTTVAYRSKPAEPPPPPPTIPRVVLSDELRAACLVDVGGALPAAELADVTGNMHALESLYGQKLSVVCFWTIGATHRSRLVAAAALQDLAKQVAEPFGNKGVAVIAVNVGNDPAAVKQELDRLDATFLTLLDPNGESFAKIAKDKRMPRTFLLDAEGRILWFDIEYSRSSRRDLRQSIRAALGEL